MASLLLKCAVWCLLTPRNCRNSLLADDDALVAASSIVLAADDELLLLLLEKTLLSR
jgi:hypothetical protein